MRYEICFSYRRSLPHHTVMNQTPFFDSIDELQQHVSVVLYPTQAR